MSTPAGAATGDGLLVVLPVRDRGKAEDLIDGLLGLRRAGEADGAELFKFEVSSTTAPSPSPSTATPCSSAPSRPCAPPSIGLAARPQRGQVQRLAARSAP